MATNRPSWAIGGKKREASGAVEVATDENAAKIRKEKDDDVKAMSNKDICLMVCLLAKLVLQNTQTIRELAACVWFTYIVSENTAFVEAIADTGKEYAKAVEGQGGNHGKGPPHVHKWTTAVQEIMNNEKIQENPKLLEKLKAYNQQKLVAASPAQVANSVPFFKLKPIFKGKGKKSNEFKLHVSFANASIDVPGELDMGSDTYDVESIFLEAFETMGGFEQKVGPGPAGQMERLVQSWVDKLKK